MPTFDSLPLKKVEEQVVLFSKLDDQNKIESYRGALVFIEMLLSDLKKLYVLRDENERLKKELTLLLGDVEDIKGCIQVALDPNFTDDAEMEQD